MVQKNRYATHYKNELMNANYPLQSLATAVRIYIRSRESWLQSCIRGKYGWRGGFLSGKLFFNRNTTKKNIALMQDVLEVIDNQRYDRE